MGAQGSPTAGIRGPPPIGRPIGARLREREPELLLQVLPLVHIMLFASRGTHHTLRHLPHALMQLNMELSAPIDGSIMRTGVGDGPARRMEVEEAAAVVRWDTALAED